ncbi:beta strand repeat-containing protein [Reichenbachiella sp.]|uniref:beta strand repeat-containing protein n=1 Tax=Reichenbachiella sp. TaxID=2184521 RepID=UPI003BAF778B
MVKQIISALAILLVASTAQAQNSIGVNTDSPSPNAAMDIKPVAGQAQGILIPRLTTGERTGMALGAADNGIMVYDETLGSLFIWNGVWNPVAIEGTIVVDGITISGDGGGTPLAVNVGNAANQIVQLDGLARLPAVDGSQLTGVTATIGAGSVTTTEIADGTIDGVDIAGTTITDANINDVDFGKVTNVPVNLDIDATDDITTADVGNAANQIVQLDGSARLPAVDGSLLTGVTATIGAGSVTTTEIADGTIAGVDIAGTTITDANINDVDFGKITNVPVNLDVDDTDDLTTANLGVAAGNVVQLDGSARLPAVDGSQLTGVTATIGAGSVTTTEIADGTIAGADIAGTTITDANINDVDFGKITNVPVNLDVDDTDDLTNADLGVAAGNVVQLDGSARLPAVDGSQLTNLPAPVLAANSVTTSEIADGTIAGADIAGTTITDANINDVDFGKVTNVPVNLDVDNTDDLTNADLGVAAGNVVQLDGSARLPAVDGSQLTNLPIIPVNSDGTTVLGDGDATALNVNVGVGPNQIVQLDGTSRLPNVDGSQLTNLPIVPINSDGTTVLGDGDATALNVNVGVGPNQIVQLDGTSRLPNIDGSQLTNLPITPVNSDGTTVLGDGDATALNVNVGVGPNQIVQLDGTSRLPNIDGSQLTNLPIVPINSDGTTVLGDGDATALNVNVGVGPNQIVQLDGTSRLPNIDGSQLTNLPITPVNSDGTTVLGDGDATALNVNVGVGPNQIVQLDGTSRLPNIDGSQLTNLPITPVNSDGTTVLGDGDATALNVNVGVGPSQIVQLDASSRLPNIDGSQLTNLPVTVASGNGVTVSGSNIDLGGVLGSTSTITTAAGSDIIIDGAGTLDVDALADFSAQSNFSNINVTGGSISGATLTQTDNTFSIEDDGTGNSATFELSALTAAHSYALPDNSGQLALTSDIAAASLWADNAGDINYSSGLVGIGTTTPGTDLHVYNNGLDQISALTVDAQGTQTSQLSAIILQTLGDGATDVGDVSTNGWMLLGYGDAFGDATRQNELSFSNFMGGTETAAVLHLEPNGNVGIGTGDPLSTFQVEQSLALSHFENATQAINGDFIGSDLYVDKTNTTDNDLVRNSGSQASFIFLENGEISFHYTPSGAANGVLSLTSDIETSLTLQNDGSAEFNEMVRFNSNEAIAIAAGSSFDRDAITTPIPGMLRFNFDDDQFEGYSSGGWSSFGNSSFSNINTPITFDGDASGLIQVNPPSSGPGGVMHLLAGDAAGGSAADGGNVILQPGFGDGAGFDGVIDLQGDAYMRASSIFSAGIDHDILVEGATSSVGNNLSVRAGDGDSGFNGGNLILAPGTGVGNPGHIEMDANTALVLPRGNDIERSGIITPIDGMIRYSNEGGSEGFEGRVSGVWQPLGGGSITGAANGLNVNGSNIELGGTLSTSTEISVNGNEFSIRRGSPTNAPTMHVYNDNGSIGTGGNIVFDGINSSAVQTEIGKVETRFTNNTAGVEASELVLSVKMSGALVEGLKIDDAGEVNANAYKYNSPVTKYYGIPPVAFNLTKKANTTDELESNGGGAVYVLATEAGTGAQLSAPVHLPDGAVIQAVEIMGRNTSGADAVAHFAAKSYSTAFTFNDVVTIPDGTSGITGFPIAASVGKIIDNNSNNYFIYIDLDTPVGPSADFTGARITYRMDYVD